jgi:histidinol-phosphate/aromatic aminotransferase/cobyric acid decarboxylase-like protein
MLKNGFLWNVSGLAEYFLGLYVRKDFLEKYEAIRIRSIKETQEFFADMANIKGLKVVPSMANFILAEIVDGSTAEDFVSKLLIKHGIYVRVGSDKIGLDGHFVRIASRKKNENHIITEAIGDILK